MKKFLITAAVLALSGTAIAQTVDPAAPGVGPTSPMSTDPATGDMSTPTPGGTAAPTNTPPPATTNDTGAMTPPPPASAAPPAGDSTTTAAPSTDPQSYPKCSKTVKDKCTNRGGK
ncbi:hypothetical protein [Sphingomonas sp. ID0503]|uniref:hypothetical protein n=1 Tax=Sphingomonas sp. ID0503 TaxID=3399691 RepID=UPI003AFA3D37